MTASESKIHTVRTFVFVAALIGLAFTLMIVAAGSANTSATRSLIIATLAGFPFVLALISLKLPRLAHQRLLWAISAALTALAALPLIFSVGVFFLALAAAFAWAAVTTRRTDAPSHGASTS